MVASGIAGWVLQGGIAGGYCRVVLQAAATVARLCLQRPCRLGSRRAAGVQDLCCTWPGLMEGLPRGRYSVVRPRALLAEATMQVGTGAWAARTNKAERAQPRMSTGRIPPVADACQAVLLHHTPRDGPLSDPGEAGGEQCY
jgi:hypothetical protein